MQNDTYSYSPVLCKLPRGTHPVSSKVPGLGELDLLGCGMDAEGNGKRKTL